jgi:hypothetical protein
MKQSFLIVNYSLLIKLGLFIALLVILLSSCAKEEHMVLYRITDAVSGFDVNYRDAGGVLVKENVDTQSGEDTWTYSFMAEEGDIVFVSAIYKDPESAIKVEVLIDQKVYKQGSSIGDTVKYVTVSGTVPY